MKVIEPPAHIAVPVYEHNAQKFQQDCMDFLASLTDHAYEKGVATDINGSVLHYPYADGFATYVVMSVAKNSHRLITVTSGDGYRSPLFEKAVTPEYIRSRMD